jgi:hypothetical protein
MTDEDARELCLELISSETEEEVIDLLKAQGYWDDPRYWRYYGDRELNWSQAGGQQARSDFALNEKGVNAIDSLLTLLCLLAGIDPEGPGAPKTIREAVARFVERAGPLLRTTAGRVEDWPPSFRRKVAENISIFATEKEGTGRGTRPCVNIADLGEGQTPEAFPLTLVSLGQLNKISIPFVQGKYCQGGTGALRYCGPNRLQLIVSRRHPELVGSPLVSKRYPQDSTDNCWGFTIVRREMAGENQKMGTLTYLAPLDAEANPRKGRVLRFAAPNMPLFPQGDTAYGRRVEHGTLIKLYEYHLKNSGNILRRDGLRPKIDLLLPDPALPIRFHECRPRARGRDANEQTETMSGLFARLRDNQNIEDAAPTSVPIMVRDRQLMARIYAFKPRKSETYRDNEGVIFTVNGQAHGYIKANIFARKSVGLQRLAKDLLVVVDCSSLNPTEIDDLFMSSRDRLDEDNPLSGEIEKRIEQVLREHPGLRELKNKRAQEDVSEQLSNEKPLEDILKQVMKGRPGLSRIFGRGDRLPNAFKPENVKTADVPPLLRPHPTYFRIAGKEQGEELTRKTHLEQGVRIHFVTDADDEYFTRRYDAGIAIFNRVNGDDRIRVTDYIGPNLVRGRCTITFDLPDHAKVGEKLAYEFVVEDQVTQKTFTNKFTLTVVPPQVQRERKPGQRAQSPGKPPGQSQTGEGGIALPDVIWLKSSQQSWSTHFRDKDDCLDIMDDGDGDVLNGVRRPVYKFYLNEENKSLETELKATKRLPQVLKKQFEVAVVLVGLAVIYDHQNARLKLVNDEDSEENPEDHDAKLAPRVRDYARAVAPILIPMIEGLGQLGIEDIEQSDLVGKAAAA